MTKADLVNEIADQTGIARTDALVAVEAAMQIIRDTMCRGENVYLRGFGTFIVKRRAEKVARDITKNTSVRVPAHNYPGFRPSRNFQDRMKEHSGRQQEE